MKKCKGITLIALIITIILLLILVGVSINLAIKGDLFGSAEKAVDGTNAKVEQEQSRVDELMGQLDRVQVHNWVKSGDNVSCNHCGLYLKIGQEIKYKDTGADTATITTAKTGYSKDQTIEKGTDVQWVVFGVEDTNKDGINESLLLTTVKPTTTGVTWSDSILEYNNGETELNRICRELYGSDARSITIDDINSTLGYKPSGAVYSKIVETVARTTEKPRFKMVISQSTDTTTKNYEEKICTTGNFTTKLKELEVWDSIKSCTVGTAGDTAEKYGDYTYNGYFYNVNTSGNIIEPINSNSVGSVSGITRDMILGTDNSYSYYAATKMVSTGCYVVENSGAVEQTALISSGSSTKSLTYGCNLGMARVSRARIGGILGGVSLLSQDTSNVLSKLEDENTTHTIVPTVQINGIQKNKERYQKTMVVVSNRTISKVRPIVTLTDNIPEQGSVITIYKATSDSQTDIRDTDMAEEGVS